MKTKFLIIVFLFVALKGHAQEWLTNFENAKSEAVTRHQNILLVFQGSDWCAPCIKLDKEIWSSQAFLSLNKNHFVMLQADFPRKKNNQISAELKTQNAQLAERYNQQGYFPLVVVLDK